MATTREWGVHTHRYPPSLSLVSAAGGFRGETRRFPYRKSCEYNILACADVYLGCFNDKGYVVWLRRVAPALDSGGVRGGWYGQRRLSLLMELCMWVRWGCLYWIHMLATFSGPIKLTTFPVTVGWMDGGVTTPPYGRGIAVSRG